MKKTFMLISPCPSKGKYNDDILDKYPLTVLKKELNERNIDVFSYDPNIKKQIDTIVFLDYAEWAFREIKYVECKYKVLLLIESIAVCPKHYEKAVTDKFDLVFSWNDDIVDNKRIIKYNVPVIGDLVKDLGDFEERKEFILINANKYSFYDTEQYSFRREIINFFEDNEIALDLYGPFWQKNYYLNPRKLLGFFCKGLIDALEKRRISKIRNLIPHFKSLNKERKCYLGITQDKYGTLSKYKYCICFENDTTPGDVTEKIFDCFFCGTIPIYFGASNIETLIPKETFIDMRDFNGFSQLFEYISFLSEEDARSIREAGMNYIESTAFYNNWRPEMVYKRIAEELDKKI